MPRLLMLGLLLALAVPTNAALVQRGDKAPAISAKDTAGATVKSDELKGKKNVLLVFWSAATCSAVEDLKAIERLDSGITGKGKPLAILGVGVDGTKAGALAKWLKSKKIAFRNLVDEKSKVADAYGVVITPTFVLVDKDGIIQSRYAGGGDAVTRALMTDIEELIQDGSVTAREQPEPSIPSG